MFAIGHFALGYLTGKGTSKALNVKLNLPLLLVASIIPDTDLILQYADPTLFMHRGPMHSIITFTVAMIPFFVIYRRRATPYYVALLSHSLIGDLLTGGIEMLWPVSHDWFAALYVNVHSLANITAEMVLFVVALAVMFKAKDLQILLKPGNHNLFLFITFGAVLGPLLGLSRNFEGSIPVLLIPMSLFWIAIFAYSLFVELHAKMKHTLNAISALYLWGD